MPGDVQGAAASWRAREATISEVAGVLYIAWQHFQPTEFLSMLGSALGVFAGLALPFGMARSTHRLAAKR